MDRSTYIGSSDAKEIMYGNWFDVWAKKTGRSEPLDFSDNFPVQLGLHTEEFHIDWTIKSLQRDFDIYARVPQPKDQQLTRLRTTTADAPLGCHLDALISEPSGTTTPVEVKHTGRFKTVIQTAQFYMPQIQHLMYCENADNLLFSAIIGNQTPARVWVERDDDWLSSYLVKCEKFWKYILDDIGPPPVFSDRKEQEIAHKIQTQSDNVLIDGFKRRSIMRDNYAMALVPEFISTKKQSVRHDEIKKELKGMMKPNESELYSDSIVLKRNKAGSIIIRVSEEA
tara:strand:+ start:18680 stop:19528 length:849 start_codon:yes stop_codon:yes gene_type:complete